MKVLNVENWWNDILEETWSSSATFSITGPCWKYVWSFTSTGQYFCGVRKEVFTLCCICKRL